VFTWTVLKGPKRTIFHKVIKQIGGESYVKKSAVLTLSMVFDNWTLIFFALFNTPVQSAVISKVNDYGSIHKKRAGPICPAFVKKRVPIIFLDFLPSRPVVQAERISALGHLQIVNCPVIIRDNR
jgi:hypothetical protein